MLPLIRLLQLASPALPVGAYTYSQGLEWAVESGAVRDEAGAARWIGDLLEWNLARFEAPLLAQLMWAWADGDDAQVAALNADFLASRETAELRAETVQMGYSLVRLLGDLDAFAALPGWRARLLALDTPSFPAAWAAAAAAWAIPTLGAGIPELAARAAQRPAEQWSNFTPGLALASSRHETQYTRLFRS